MNEVTELTKRDPSRPTVGEPIVEAVAAQFALRNGVGMDELQLDLKRLT